MPRRDEIGELAETFNRMTVAVAEREEQLREGEERFRTMTESAVDAVVTADANGDIVSWNRGARDVFGYAPEEVLGTPLARLVPSHLRRGRPSTDGSALAPTACRRPRSSARSSSTACGRTAGCFPIELSIGSWEKRRRADVQTAILRDVTERRQLEEQFRQAQKMEASGGWPAGWPTTSTTCSPSSAATASSCRAARSRTTRCADRSSKIQKAAERAAT